MFHVDDWLRSNTKLCEICYTVLGWQFVQERGWNAAGRMNRVQLEDFYMGVITMAEAEAEAIKRAAKQ